VLLQDKFTAEAQTGIDDDCQQRRNISDWTHRMLQLCRPRRDESFIGRRPQRQYF